MCSSVGDAMSVRKVFLGITSASIGLVQLLVGNAKNGWIGKSVRQMLVEKVQLRIKSWNNVWRAKDRFKCLHQYPDGELLRSIGTNWKIAKKQDRRI